MLKVRVMGTKNDIVWFQKLLQRHPKVEITFIEIQIKWLLKNNDSSGNNGGNNGGDRSNRLSENEQIIIKQIKQDGSLTAKMMSENTGIPKRTVERAIKQLKEKSIIIRKGSSRKGYWEYTEK